MNIKTRQLADAKEPASPKRTGESRRSRLRRSDKAMMEMPASIERTAEPVALRHVAVETTELMLPGDILLLEGTHTLRELVDTAFFAILACPLCGKLDLLTQAQYSGTETVICGYDDCSCHFRINGREEIAYLPVN